MAECLLILNDERGKDTMFYPITILSVRDENLFCRNENQRSMNTLILFEPTSSENQSCAFHLHLSHSIAEEKS